MRVSSLLVLFFTMFTVSVFGQIGPAGIGTSDGSVGPRNVLWLRADVGVTETGTVSAWADQTTNGLNATQGTLGLQPSFNAANAAFNGLPSMNFLPGGAANYHLAVPDNDLLDNSPGMSFFIVMNPSLNGVQGILNKRTDAGVNQSYRIYRAGGDILSNISNGSNATIAMANSANIFSSIYDQSLTGNRYNLFVNSTTNASSPVTTTLANQASPLYIGNFDLTDSRSFNGDIAEIIIYNEALNGAEKIIVENYLSEKYNLTIGANDFFSLGDPAFNNDLTGIGTANGTDKSSLSGFSDALQINELGSTLDAPDEYIMLAHDNTTHDQTITTDFTDPDITDRWARSWYMEVPLGGSVSADLRFDFGVAGLGAVGSASDYVLLYRPTTGIDYARVLANSISIENGDQVVVNLSNQDLPTGYYTLGRGAQLVNTTYYSFQSGNWQDPIVWTTDPSGNDRVPNTGNLPTAGANTVILSGRTVTMATDDNDGVSLTVDGQLNIENTSGHNFFSISGNGIISIKGDDDVPGNVVDNFPTGSTSDFADPIVGGTLFIEGDGLNLNASRTYNNVMLNLTASSNVAILLDDYVINGDFTVQSGIFQINDNASTTNLNIDVQGDVQIDASGELNVGEINARHQFNFYGNFINNGRAEFTNRGAPIYVNEATDGVADGIVDANFLSGDKDQSIDCFGVTNFYRIEIDKGADQTYILDINADAGNFGLYGAATTPTDGAQLSENLNALGLIRGTVRLNTNADVPVLNDGGNYSIFESARLWVNGADVATEGNSIVPYGTVQISSGTLLAPGQAGITTRDNGTIIVEGGTVTTNQIRTSVLGADNIGGYFQSGGTVNVTGGAIGTSYYTFSLTYSGNTFNMSGGVLNVSGSQPLNGTAGGGIFIKSDPGNISVTGGTVIMENTTNTNFKVTSNAPFWNVIMRSTGGTATEVELDTGFSGPGGTPETILVPELLVLNDLTIEDGVTFDHNGFDVEIGSDFTIQATGDYIYDGSGGGGRRNTTYFNGVDDAVMNFQNRNDATGEQRFWNLVIDRPTGVVMSLESAKISRSGNDNNLLRVDGGHFKILSGTLDQGEHSIRMYADSLVNYDQLTVFDPTDPTDDLNANGDNDLFKLRPDSFVLLTADTSRFGNLRLNNGSEIVTLDSDLKIDRLEYRYGRIDLGEHNLKLDILSINLNNGQTDWNSCGGCNSVEDMFITNGLSSAGGLSLYVPSDGSLTFPIGIGTDGIDVDLSGGNSKYTPAQATLSGVTDDGYITIRPVDNTLPTTDPTGGDVLSYYWKVDFEDFTTPPEVEYVFTYYDADDDNTGETGFVAGKVLEQVPFDRDYEDEPAIEGVDDTNNTITFNGPLDVGFTLESASYTAGEFGRFVGAPEIYYTRSDGNWNQTNIWSTVSHTGGAAADFPQAGDVAIIGYDGANDYHRINAVGDVNVAILEFDSYADATAKNIRLSRLTFGTTENLNADIVRGIGELHFQAANGVGPGLINAGSDLGDFVEYKRSSFIYNLSGNQNVIISALNKYPSLRFYAAGANSSAAKNDLFFLDKDTECSNLLLDGNSALEITNNIIVNDTLFIGANRDGELIFNNGAVANSIETDYLIFGSDLFTTNRQENRNKIFVNSGGGNGTEHRLIVNKDILVATGSGGVYPDLGAAFDLFTSATDNNVILELRDDGNNAFEIEGDDDIGSNGIQFIPEFYRIVMNKGTSVSSTFDFNDGFTLEGATNGATKALTLQNGLIRLNSNEDDINIDLSTGGGDFSIPSSTGLHVTQAQVNVSGTDTGIILDGQLIIDGGTVDMDDAVGNGNNFIEYSASGNALLEISAGTLNVGSQIRGITSAETGVLKYRQTGGDVRIGTQAGPENTRGMLQIYNVGSEFTYTGGTLIIERHQDAPTVAALFLNPDDSDVTETIEIFNGTTPGGQTNFRINSVIPLANLIIHGSSGNNPEAEIDINALTVEGNLTITTGATLNGNARTLTIGGDLDNDGAYEAQLNETIFNSTGTQQITGAGTNNFFQFTKSDVGTLDLTSTLNVADLFTISDGILADNGFSINLDKDAVIDGSHASAGGDGLVFNGGIAQELRSSTAGTGSLGVVSVNNANGLTIPDGNGYNFNIDGGLRLENGVFNVGGSEILFGVNAEITEVNTFGLSNMIRTSSSFTDGGVGKVFAAGTRADFIFPIGQIFYTPVTFDFATPGNTAGSGGTIIIISANEAHPTINDGVPDLVLPLATGDVNNALQYYWTLRTTGFTGFTSDMTLEYDQSDVLTDEPGLEETNYIAARILSQGNPTFLINKFTDAEVFEPNTILFNFPGVSSDNISGDYFAGIDQAIPNNVTTYIVQGAGGDANTEVYDLDVPGVGNYPSGSVVVIPNGTTLTLPSGIDGLRLYATEIQDGGVLEVDNSTNHRLGELTGTGTLKIVSDDANANLPSFSGSFLSCTGGGLEYAGTGSYGVLGGITSVRNLTLSGSGSLTLANNDITICEDLTINGDAPGLILNNPNNININVTNDLIVTSGTFNKGSGQLSVFGNVQVNGGNYNHTSGRSRFFGDLIITSGSFDVGFGGAVQFLTSNDDLIYSGGSFTAGSGSRIWFLGDRSITGNFTGVSSFYRVDVQNSNGISLNNSIEISNALNLNNGIINANGNDVILGSSIVVTPAPGTSSSYINGKVLKMMSNIGDDFTFPIGSTSLWRPATVNNVSVGGSTWEAQFFDQEVVANTIATTMDVGDPAIIRLQGGEYFVISDGNAAPSGETATVGLSWGTETDVSAGPTQRQQLKVMVWNTASSEWDDKGGVNFSGGNTISQGSFESSVSTSFSERIFILGSSDAANALPITLESFTGYVENDSHYLEWITSSEINNDYFELQRSVDGLTYEVLTTVEGAGTTSDKQFYDYVDRSPVFGKNYYRLVQVDIDGTRYDEGDIILLENANQLERLDYKMYPNPTRGSNVNLEISTPDSDREAVVSMYDLQGRRYYRGVISSNQLFMPITIQLSNDAKSGMYIVIVEQGDFKVQKKLLIR